MSQEESKEKPFIPSHVQRSPATDKDKQHRDAERKVRQLRMDFALTFGPDEGKRVLKWMFQQSGYGQSDVGGNPALGMDVLQGTFYNSARKSLYIEMRKLIPHETLKNIEFENVEEELI